MSVNSLQNRDFTGIFLVICGTTGSGKGTIREYIHEHFPHIKSSLSYVTRPMRTGEVNGVGYYFISNEEFDTMIANDEFLEWIEKYGGKKYGTSKIDIVEALEQNEVIESEIDIDGVKAVLDLLPRKNVFILAVDGGDWETVSARIIKRSELSEEEYELRKQRFCEEDPYFKSVADVIIANQDGKLETTQKQLHAVVTTLLDTHNATIK